MNVTLDANEVARAYSGVLSQLRKLTGFSPMDILLGEAGIILKTAAGRTKVMTQDRIQRRARLAALRKHKLTSRPEGTDGTWVTINAGSRGEEGRVWLRTRNDKFQLAGHVSAEAGRVGWQNTHFRDKDWQTIVNKVNAYRAEYPKQLKLVQGAVGLARQSWIQIADSLGIDLATVKGGGTLSAAGIAKARAAMASNGNAYVNGLSTSGGDDVTAQVTLINRLPYAASARTTDGKGFAPLLTTIINGRVKYFTQSYAKGAFDSIFKTARAFPWVKVSSTAGQDSFAEAA